MPTVADALDPNFRRSWHEAVAIVQEVASQLLSGLNVPDAEHLHFDDTGALTFGFASEGMQDPLFSVAVLLKGLLEGTGAPPGLQQLADENAKPSPAHTTVESFARALAFYERPGRHNDLRAVATRLATGEPVVNPEGVVEELREKIASHHIEPEGVHRSSHRRRVVMAAAAVIFVAVVSAGAVLVRRHPAGAKKGPAVVDGIEQRIADVVSAGLNRLGGVKRASTDAPPEAAAVIDEPRAKGATAKPRRSGPTPSRGTTTIPGAVLAAPSIAIEPSAMAPIPYAIDSGPPAVEVASPTAGTAIANAAVYSAADPNVRPPIFVRPQLAKLPAADSRTGYFDIVVSDTGDVQMVKLFSPADNFRDRMLVAAAKAWRFRPAMLDGRPVSYRMRVSIILPGNP